MVLKIFKKKRAPPTLPDLAINIPNNQQQNNQTPQQQQSQENSLYQSQTQPSQLNNYNPQPLPKQDYFSQNNLLPLKKELRQLPENQVNQQQKGISDEKLIKQYLTEDKEAGFFKDLMKNITQEIKDVEKLDKWYKGKLKEEDMINQMRKYWENQKPELMLRNVNNEMVTKLRAKIESLHKLEKDWQDIYVNLISKEEQMREEEKDLKESLSEFIEVCRKKLGKDEA